VKGPSQTSARNESERDSADTGGRACHEWRSPAQGKPRDVTGVGMMGTETCVTEGDLVCSEKRRLRVSELLSEGESRRERGSEESERFIVATTPCESREQ
jgi:hypothetical protein